MKSSSLVQYLSYLEPLGCLLLLAVLRHQQALKSYFALSLYLLTRAVSAVLLLTILHNPYLSDSSAYWCYFSVFWSSYALEAFLGFAVILGIYRLAMAPLPGLQRLGMLMFRWAGGIAIAIALTMALGPKVDTLAFGPRAITQLQQTQSVLTLCMLLFVCVTIKPMGLSHRSRIFGVSLGLGVLATTDLIESAWLSHLKGFAVTYNLISGSVILLTLLIWAAYFVIPEPKRRMIILPTTSPFLRWNQISLALGDAPGFVAIGEVSTDLFDPSEVEIMRRASVKMRRIAI